MRKLLLLALLLGLVVSLFFVNAVYIGVKLPNFSRTYTEGMSTNLMSFDTPVRFGSTYGPVYEFFSYYNLKLLGKKWALNYLIINSFHFFVLILFSYLLGKAVKDRETGLLTALLMCLYPLTSATFNMFSMDFPLLGIIVMWMYFLFRSNLLSDLRWSVMLGLATLYGLLMKEPFAAFIVGPLLYALFAAIKDARNKDFKRLVTFYAMSMTVIAVISVHYNYGLVWHFWGRLFMEQTGHRWYDWNNLKLFVTGLWDSQLTLPFLLILAASMVPFFKEADRRLKIVLLLWVLVPNLFVLFMPRWKTERLLLPQLPALALVSAFGLRRLVNKPLGIAAILLITAFGVAQVYDFTYAQQGLSKLRYKNYYYWNPSELKMSFSDMRKDSAYAEKIGKTLLEDILKREASGGEVKRVYPVIYTEEDWSLEAFSVRTYSLMNSTKLIDPVYKPYFLPLLIKSHEVQRIEYLVCVIEPGAGRADSLKIEPTVEFLSRNTIGVKIKPEEMLEAGRKWALLLKDFKEFAKIEADGGRAAYLYRNISI